MAIESSEPMNCFINYGVLFLLTFALEVFGGSEDTQVLVYDARVGFLSRASCGSSNHYGELNRCRRPR
jgi:hypothetical protein